MSNQGTNIEQADQNVAQEFTEVQNSEDSPVNIPEVIMEDPFSDLFKTKEETPGETSEEISPENSEVSKESYDEEITKKLTEIDKASDESAVAENTSLMDMRATLQAQQALINELKKNLDETRETFTQKQESPKEEIFDPFDGKDFDEVMSDQEKFMGLMNRLFEKFSKPVFEKVASLEKVLHYIPDVAVGQVEKQRSFMSAVDKFFTINPDLDFRQGTDPTSFQRGQILANLASKIQTENPTYSPEQVLNETETVARSILNIPKQGKTTSQKDTPGTGIKNTGSFSGKATTPRSAQSTTMNPIQKQISDFLTSAS